jgi:hypothetical protein
VPRYWLTVSWGKYLQMPLEDYLVKEVGTPTLDFTESEHRIIGIKHTPNKNWLVQVETYQNVLDKLIIGTGQLPPNNFANARSGTTYGVDVLVKRDYQNRKMGWLSYSYVQSERHNDLTNETIDFAGEQPHTLTLVWSQPFTRWLKNWTWGIKLQAHSGKPYTEITGRAAQCKDTSNNDEIAACPTPDSEQQAAPYEFYYWKPAFGDTNAQRAPFYYRVDFRLDREFKFNRWKMNLYFDLQNVTFRQNITGYNYGKNYERIDNPTPVTGLPFMPFFGIEAEF